MRSKVSAYSPKVISRSPTLASTCLACSGLSGPLLAPGLAAEPSSQPLQAPTNALTTPRSRIEARDTGVLGRGEPWADTRISCGDTTQRRPTPARTRSLADARQLGE